MDIHISHSPKVEVLFKDILYSIGIYPPLEQMYQKRAMFGYFSQYSNTQCPKMDLLWQNYLQQNADRNTKN